LQEGCSDRQTRLPSRCIAALIVAARGPSPTTFESSIRPVDIRFRSSTSVAVTRAATRSTLDEGASPPLSNARSSSHSLAEGPNAAARSHSVPSHAAGSFRSASTIRRSRWTAVRRRPESAIVSSTAIMDEVASSHVGMRSRASSGFGHPTSPFPPRISPIMACQGSPGYAHGAASRSE